MTRDLGQRQADFLAALRAGDEAAARAVVTRAQADGLDASTIYYQIFAPSMVTVGLLWEQNELSVAEEHLATAITERLIGQLSPAFDRPASTSAGGSVVLGCVVGERHALGLRMLADLFRAAGWRVLYLGPDVPNADWVRLAQRFSADLVAISASQLRHVLPVQTLIGELRAALPELQIMVGGAIFTLEPELWRAIGADLHHPDPEIAVRLATERRLRPAARPAERAAAASGQPS